MHDTITLELPDPAATETLGRQIGGLLAPGAVVALIGQLGSGKTFLVRAIAEGLGIRDPRTVSSPTFVLIQEYQAKYPIAHFDTYRLRNEGEFFDLGIQEYYESGGICLIEWADRVAGALPADVLHLSLEVIGPQQRRVLVHGTGPRAKALVAALKNDARLSAFQPGAPQLPRPVGDP